MFDWLRRLWAWLLAWVRTRRLPEATTTEPTVSAPPTPQPVVPPYEVVHVAEEPDEFQPQTLYAVGEKGTLWQVALLCPCGCGAKVSLNALPDDSPRWSLRELPGGPTVSPSVRRTVGCRSHFILRRGQVIWCEG